MKINEKYVFYMMVENPGRIENHERARTLQVDSSESGEKQFVWWWSTACFKAFLVSRMNFIMKTKKTMPKQALKNKCGHGSPEGENRPPCRRRVLRTILIYYL